MIDDFSNKGEFLFLTSSVCVQPEELRIHNHTFVFIYVCVHVVHLKERLEEYIKQWNGLVKLFRNEKREGLIQARSIGAKKATKGQV